jgi:Na+/H+ antiporter NhaC
MHLAEARTQNQPSATPTATNDITSKLSQAKPIYFFLPLVVLIAATLLLEKDALKGVMAALVFTFLFYGAFGVMKFTEVTDGIFEGFKSMVFALAILTMSYVLKMVGDKMGLTPFVINSVQPVLSKELLAAAIFASLSFISYTTASSWGMYAVAIPIVVPLANAMGANVWLALAAVVSSGAFGSQASFFSDVTVLTATSTECNNMELSYAQFPYNLVAWGLSVFLFLAFGYF